MTEASSLIENLRTDCMYYLGDRPCRPHVEAGHRCTCIHFQPTKRRGVIIKLGAAGDVLRSTPLLRSLDPFKTGTKILWITHSLTFCLPTPVKRSILLREHWRESLKTRGISVGTWTKTRRHVPSPHLRKRWNIEVTRFGTARLIRLMKRRGTNLRPASITRIAAAIVKATSKRFLISLGYPSREKNIGFAVPLPLQGKGRPSFYRKILQSD